MSERVDIEFGSVANEPNDYSPNSGDLSLAINAVKHNGSMRSVSSGKAIPNLSLAEGEEAMYIHDINTERHIIIAKDNSENKKISPKRKAPTKTDYAIYLYNMSDGIRVSVKCLYRRMTSAVSTSGEFTWEEQDATKRPSYPLTLTFADGTTEDVEIDNEVKVTSITTSMLTNYSTDNQVVSARCRLMGALMYTYVYSYVSTRTDDDIPTETLIPDYLLRYVVCDKDDYSIEEGAEEISISQGVVGEILNITGIGNTLIVTCDGTSPVYYLWKDGEYQYLGDGFDSPEIFPYLETRLMGLGTLFSTYGAEFSEELKSTISSDSIVKYDDFKKLYEGKADSISISSSSKLNLYNRLFAIINSAHNIISKDGGFYAPFYIRFALRLYDGRRVMHTPPMLMFPTSSCKPTIGVNIISDGTAYIHPIFSNSQLCADINIKNERYKDIISHLDVYVSPPLIDYTDDYKTINNISIKDDSPIYMKGKLKLGELYSDYESEGSDVYFDITSRVWPAEKKLVVHLAGYSKAFIAYDISENVHWNWNSINYNKAFSDNWDRTLFTRADGSKLKLSDCGIETLANMKYYCPSDWQFAEIKPDKDVTVFYIKYKGKDPNDLGDNSEKGFKWMINYSRADGNNIKDIIQDNTNFYLVKSFPYEDISGGFNGQIDVGTYLLNNLTGRPTLEDSGQCRNMITCNVNPYNYNNRLNIPVYEKLLPESSEFAKFIVSNEYDNASDNVYQAFVKVVENNQTSYKNIKIGSVDNERTFFHNIYFFSYPSSCAEELLVISANMEESESPYIVLKYPLTKHSILNYSFIFNSFNKIEPSESISYQTLDDAYLNEDIAKALDSDEGIIYGNLLRVSDANNPFYFNEGNSVTLPTGKIFGLSTTAEALSEGQFGEYPLYAFTSDGIWSIKVSDDGTYSSRQPISRDVCNNPDSITQTDKEVMFTTKRGLMSINGSSVQHVSNILDGHNYTDNIPHLGELEALCGYDAVDFPEHISDYLETAHILYDNKRQLLYIYQDATEDTSLPIGYVYSITDKTYGMFINTLKHGLNSYTDAIAVEANGDGTSQLVNMSEDNDRENDTINTMIVTRPLHFGKASPKTLSDILVKGVYDINDDSGDHPLKVVVWASNDCKAWKLVGSSNKEHWRCFSGTPYQYYRIGVLATMKEQDSIDGATCEITERLNNRIR